jgi:GDP-4-dehydro-6-deoxy-D-mannose reductase
MGRALVTGCDGFMASHLVDYILDHEPDWDVYGTCRRLADKKNIVHRLKEITVLDMELTDPHSVLNAVRTARPDKVFHLAGQSFVPISWTSPAGTFETNAVGTANILEAVRLNCVDAYVQVAASSEEYGLVHPDECPINEDLQPLRPLSPYGVSKVAADLFGYQYARSYGMNITRTRTFNTTGPRRGEMFVTSDFAKQVALIEKKKQKPVIVHGNLQAIRDFTDVRDTVRAYWLLSNKRGTGDVYNICSGIGHSMLDVLETLLRLSYFEDEISHHTEQARMRPSDVALLIGCNSKVVAATGWGPEYRFEDTMKDLLDYWRERV